MKRLIQFVFLYKKWCFHKADELFEDYFFVAFS